MCLIILALNLCSKAKDVINGVLFILRLAAKWLKNIFSLNFTVFKNVPLIIIMHYLLSCNVTYYVSCGKCFTRPLPPTLTISCTAVLSHVMITILFFMVNFDYYIKFIIQQLRSLLY